MSIKIIQITDLHLNKARELEVNGVNTFDSANKVLGRIKKDDNDADCMLRCRDLSNDYS